MESRGKRCTYGLSSTNSIRILNPMTEARRSLLVGEVSVPPSPFAPRYIRPPRAHIGDSMLSWMLSTGSNIFYPTK